MKAGDVLNAEVEARDLHTATLADALRLVQTTLHHVLTESEASKVDINLSRDAKGSAGKPVREDRQVHYRAPRHGQIRIGHGRPQVTW